MTSVYTNLVITTSVYTNPVITTSVYTNPVITTSVYTNPVITTSVYTNLACTVKYSVVQISLSLLTITLYCSVITILFYNDKKHIQSV
jgi:hypothetical protein